MKRTLAACLLAFCTVYLSAQSYQKFVVEGAHWNMSESYCGGCDPINPYPLYENSYCFKLEGDTIVDSLTYKKIFESFTNITYPVWGVTLNSTSNWGLIALVREDTLHQKVFIRGITGCYPPDSWCGISTLSDSLLFDFATITTDSVIVILSGVPGACGYANFPVNTTDTEIIYGAQRRVTILNDSQDYSLKPFKLIEGVGYSFGLFGAPGLNFESKYETALNSYCIGPDSICGTCYNPTLGIANINASAKIRLYPNPASDYVIIETDEVIKQATISDITGKVVSSQSFNNSKITVSLGGLSKGIYLIKVNTPQGESNKLIVID